MDRHTALNEIGAAKAENRLANLHGANLHGADLSGANLRSANLRSADLSGADLSGANLYGADLRSADLRSANLRSANLRSADLSGADLRSADLSGANLYDAGHDSRGFRFWAWRRADGVVIYRAGCREWGNFDVALAHYGPGYSSNGNPSECIARLNVLKLAMEG